jgi:hypothetical protein
MIVLDQGGVAIPASAKMVRDRLREIDPRLGVVLIPNPELQGKPWWAITEWWADNDPRRIRVRTSEIAPDEAFDILCFLPQDCSVEQAYGYVVRTFKQLQGTASERARVLLERVHLYNKGKSVEAVAETKELADELFAANDPTRKHFFQNESSAKSVRPERDRKDLRDYLASNPGAY